jgi:hypothetical protein
MTSSEVDVFLITRLPNDFSGNVFTDGIFLSAYQLEFVCLSSGNGGNHQPDVYIFRVLYAC